MLMDRIIKAFTFKREVYAEVEHDTSFTSTAWMLVAVVAFLNQLGSFATAESISGWLIGTVAGTVVAVIGFALAAFVIAWVGKSMFQADVNFEEMVRTLGLAYVWNIVGAAGVLGAFVPFLSCILTPAICLAWIMGVISWFIATQEALDLDTGSTAITVIIGIVIQFVVTLIGGAIMGLIGLAGATILSVFGG